MSKSGVGGTLLAEAKYINLSLHFLESVIYIYTYSGVGGTGVGVTSLTGPGH